MKIYTLVISLFAYAIVHVNGAAVANTSSSINLGSLLKSYYEALRNVMPCGVQSLSIPVLAPFTVEQWNFNFQNEQINVSGVLDNIEITGLDNFRILNSNFNKQSGVISLDLFHPEIQMLSEFSIDEKFNIFGTPLDIPGDGLLNLKISDHRHIIQVRVNVSESGVQIQDYQSQIIVGDIKYNNWNNVWSASTNKLVNRIAREIALYAIDEFLPYLNSHVNAQVLPQLNQQLSHVTFSSILSALSDITSQFQAVDCKLPY